MELKRILARDTRSANEKAMQLYGDDVLVISTQRVGDQTELIVAIDADAKRVEADLHRQVPSQGQTSASDKDEVFAEIFGFVQRQEKMAQAVTRHVESISTTPSSTADLPPALPLVEAEPMTESMPLKTKSKRPSTPKANSTRRAKRATSSAKKSQRPLKPEVDMGMADLLQQELARSREIVDLLRQEIGVLRREFILARQVQPWESNLHLTPSARAVVDQMVALGVPTGLRALLTDALAGCESSVVVAKTLRETMTSHLRSCLSDPLPKGVHALIGPSGAGKTSMAVRLAQMHSLEHGVERQAIIGFADKRPGAWSQLQAMAAGVGVDVYRAHDVDTLRVLLGELDDKTHVWIDTRSEAHFAVSPILSEAHPHIHCHAVAPLDASVATMQRLQASATTWRSLMLTKADECDCLWHWLQALSERAVPISFVSHSLRPDVAAEVFAPEAWVERILSGFQLGLESPEPKHKAKPATRRRRTAVSEKAAHG